MELTIVTLLKYLRVLEWHVANRVFLDIKDNTNITTLVARISDTQLFQHLPFSLKKFVFRGGSLEIWDYLPSFHL